jgi:hypothetical protein
MDQQSKNSGKVSTFLDAVKIIKDAWNAVTESNLKGVCKKLCPEFVQDFEGFENPVANVTETVTEIANRLDLKVSPEDVTELLQFHSQDLSSEDLIEMEEQGIVEEDEGEQDVAMETAHLPAFTIQKLVEAFRHIKSAVKIFETGDPNFECSLKVLEAMKNAYACYKEIYHKKEKASSVQTSLDSYFKEPQPMQKSPQKATVATEPSQVLTDSSEVSIESSPSNLVRRLSFEDSDECFFRNGTPIYKIALMGNKGSTYDCLTCDRRSGTNEVISERSPALFKKILVSSYASLLRIVMSCSLYSLPLNLSITNFHIFFSLNLILHVATLLNLLYFSFLPSVLLLNHCF